MPLATKRFFSLLLLFLMSHKSMANSAAEAITHNGGYQTQLGQVLGALLFILLLIFALVWLLKKSGYTGAMSSKGLSIKAYLPLSNREKLYVIQAGDEQILIGVTAGSINTLKTLDTPLTEQESKSAAKGTFADRLQKIIMESMAEKGKQI